MCGVLGPGMACVIIVPWLWSTLAVAASPSKIDCDFNTSIDFIDTDIRAHMMPQVSKDVDVEVVIGWWSFTALTVYNTISQMN